MFKAKPRVLGAFTPEWSGGGGWAFIPEWSAIDGERLVYSPVSGAEDTPFLTGVGILDDFMEDMGTGNIPGFVMTHGVLGLFPGGHWEPIRSWALLYACVLAVRQAGLLRKANTARDEMAQAAFDAATAFCGTAGSALPAVDAEWRPTADTRTALAVEALAAAADLRPWVNTTTMHMELHGRRSPMLGHLVLALMADMADTTLIGKCSGCKMDKPLQRRPTPKRRAFCHECRNSGTPLKVAAKDYRRRIEAGEQDAPASLLRTHRRPRD